MAQVLDYMESTATWTCADLEAEVKIVRTITDQEEAGSLYGLVSEQSELAEQRFNDAVSRKLGSGHGIFLIVADGIREEVDTPVNYVQRNAGLRFRLALVEIASWRFPDDDDFLLQPRAVVRIENGQIMC